MTIIVAASTTFAYGPSFSTGQGMTCNFGLSASVVNRESCPVHVVSETNNGPSGSGTDFEGKPYTTVTQVTDTVACYETYISALTPLLKADLSQSPEFTLPGFSVNYHADTHVKYNNNSAGIDVEDRSGVRTYIYKNTVAELEQNDIAKLTQLAGAYLQFMKVKYSDTAKTMVLIYVDRSYQMQTMTATVDMAKNVKLNSGTFTIPLDVQGLGLTPRKYNLFVNCFPETTKTKLP